MSTSTDVEIAYSHPNFKLYLGSLPNGNQYIGLMGKDLYYVCNIANCKNFAETFDKLVAFVRGQIDDTLHERVYFQQIDLYVISMFYGKRAYDAPPVVLKRESLHSKWAQHHQSVIDKLAKL